MDNLQFYVLFNSISVISGLWACDNERLCALERCLQLKRSLPQAELESRTARSVGQGLTYWITIIIVSNGNCNTILGLHSKSLGAHFQYQVQDLFPQN